MDLLAIIAGLGGALVAGLAFFFVGRSTGRGAEVQRQQAAKATAEEVSKRIVADAERDADNLKKSAVVSGKEEIIKLREQVEAEVRGRRKEVEADERRASEKESVL